MFDVDWRKELFYWQYSNTGSFTNQLYSLIAKADEYNRARIFQGYPEAVLHFKVWEQSESNDSFFKEYLNQGIYKGLSHADDKQMTLLKEEANDNKM